MEIETKTTKDLQGLIIPVVDPNHQTSIIFSEEETERWIQELPMADLGKTTKLLTEFLSELNISQVDIFTRENILAKLYNIIDYICDELGDHYIYHAKSLTDKQIQIIDIDLNILLQTIYSHTLMLSNGNFHEQNFINIFKYLNLLQLKHYQNYKILPKDFWQQIKLIYTIAEKKLTDLTPINKWFYSSLLMHIFNLYATPHEQDAQIDELCAELQDLLELNALAPDENSIYIYYFNFNNDKPPTANREHDEDICLSVEHICNKMRERALEPAVYGDFYENVTKNLESHLHKNIIPDLEQLKKISSGVIATSISGIHEILLSDKQSQTNNESENIFVDLNDDANFFSSVKNHIFQVFINFKNLDHATLTLSEEDKYPAINPSQLTILKDDHENNWCIGETLWMIHKGKNFHLGLRIMDLDPNAIKITLSKQSHEHSFQAILLKNSIITDILPFHTGDEIEFGDNHYVLNELIYSSVNFKQFNIEKIANKTKNQVSDSIVFPEQEHLITETNENTNQKKEIWDEF